MVVEVSDATFGYGRRAVVRVEALALHAGRCLGVFGPNGAGKSTLVRGVTGLLKPMTGTVRHGGGAAPVRFGYLPQQRAMELHWPMTGFDAAAMAFSARRRFGHVGRRDAAAVLEAMDEMEAADLSRRPFAKLSGGQQQRLLLAGALADKPAVLVLDEPTDGLDVRSRRMLLDSLRRQNAGGLCTVVISHDVEDLFCLAEEVAWLHPPDDPEAPSRVEVIPPEQLADRVAHARRAS